MFSKFAPKYAALALSVLAAISLAGCKEQAATVQKGPQEVGVVTVETSSPIMTTELSGRTSAYQVAEVRPQISGSIQKRIFTEGQMVKAGDQLYQGLLRQNRAGRLYRQLLRRQDHGLRDAAAGPADKL